MRTQINKRPALTAALAAILVSGCAAGTGEGITASADRAGRMMERALSQLEKEQPSYRTDREVVADGVPVPKLQASSSGTDIPGAEEPPKLEEILRLLREGGYTVEAAADPANPGYTVIKAEGEAGAWTEWNRKDWSSRIAAMQTGAADIIERRASKLGGQEAVRLRTELNDSLNLARSKMEGIVESLQAGGTCSIRLSNGKALPDSLTVENRLRYKADGRERNETIRTTYDFSRAGGGAQDRN